MTDADQTELLSPRQAYEAAHRFIARYYDHERSGVILSMLDALPSCWAKCLEDTLAGAPLPKLPPPWVS